VGPILAVILGFAAAQDSVLAGIVLLAVYSMGLAIPFLLTALGIELFLKFYSRFRAHMHAVEVGSGALLIALGLLLVFGRLTLLSNYLSFSNRFAL
jgi:cytochrome c-type biogenesis protein